jgi:hypothetical protein
VYYTENPNEVIMKHQKGKKEADSKDEKLNSEI